MPCTTEINLGTIKPLVMNKSVVFVEFSDVRGNELVMRLGYSPTDNATKVTYSDALGEFTLGAPLWVNGVKGCISSISVSTDGSAVVLKFIKSDFNRLVTDPQKLDAVLDLFLAVNSQVYIPV